MIEMGKFALCNACFPNCHSKRAATTSDAWKQEQTCENDTLVACVAHGRSLSLNMSPGPDS